jgi:sorbitol/mannitol transport system substrate-binding protein
VSSVIAGKKTVDEALNNGQKLAQAAGDKYKGK